VLHPLQQAEGSAGRFKVGFPGRRGFLGTAAAQASRREGKGA